MSVRVCCRCRSTKSARRAINFRFVFPAARRFASSVHDAQHMLLLVCGCCCFTHTQHRVPINQTREWCGTRALVVSLVACCTNEPTNTKKHTQHTQHEYNYTHAAPAACFGEGRALIAGASYACNASVNDRRQYVPRRRAGSRIVDAKSARRTVVVVHRHIAFTTRSPRAMKINVQSARE